MKPESQECSTHNLEEITNKVKGKSVKSIVPDRHTTDIEKEKWDRGEIDRKKYDTSRKIPILEIRKKYQDDLQSEDKKIRQRGVILYIMDKLALRPGMQKKKGDTSNTTGCCSLRKKHIQLQGNKGDQKYVVKFNFIGKCSIPFEQQVQVEKRVFQHLQEFLDSTSQEDDYIFDSFNTPALNKYLKTIMKDLTAKVFRTYRACQIMQKELDRLTCEGDTEADKIQSFKKANKNVATILNHKRAIAQKSTQPGKKLQTKRESKEYEIETNTSKMYYIDPRIVIAWCKKFGVLIENIYTERQRTIFSWAMTSEADYQF